MMNRFGGVSERWLDKRKDKAFAEMKSIMKRGLNLVDAKESKAHKEIHDKILEALEALRDAYDEAQELVEYYEQEYERD